MPTGGVGEVLARVETIAPVIRDHAAEFEQLGHLAPTVIEAITNAELFGMLVPVELGGFGLTIPEFVQVTERVASFDASTSWTRTILADGPLFARFLAPEIFERLCSSPTDLIASSLNPIPARAERVDGGYIFSGNATYRSGSAHAQWIIAAALVTENGEPVFSDTGFEIRAGVFPIEQARSLDPWNVTGMRATEARTTSSTTSRSRTRGPSNRSFRAPRTETRSARSRCGPSSDLRWPPARWAPPETWWIDTSSSRR